MNSLFIVIVSVIIFIWAYTYYARKLEHLWEISHEKKTPAHTKYDGLDYIPAKNWLVLFGHHFSSIAGAGPVIGPVIAVMLWGWLPALLWVLVGSIFIGGVHDFGSMITSVREGGSSIADIAHSVLSRKAKIIFSLFVWLALILVIAVFLWLCADTFVKEPKIVLPSLGLIPVSLLVGYFMYHKQMNIWITTAFGLVMLAGLIIWGNSLPIRGDLNIWIAALIIYCYVASILPVNILLQPRDYLSSFLLFFGVSAGYVGLILARPVMKMPLYHNVHSSEGYLWPALFITVACGAVSGFHSLIASGTSSKQVSSEKHIRLVGYGGMIAEGMVAILAIIAIAVLFSARDDLFGILKNQGPIALFGQGFGVITDRVLSGHGQLIAITLLNAFILTTLDTATRISRYLTEELFAVKNRYLSTLCVIIVSTLLALSGKWQRIWPVFGASNQLVAALALFVITCWLLSQKKKIKITLVPALFMLATSVCALIFQSARYLAQNDILLFSISVILVLLALFMVREVIFAISARRKKYV